MDDKLRELRKVDSTVDANWSVKFCASLANNFLEEDVKKMKVCRPMLWSHMIHTSQETPYKCGGFSYRFDAHYFNVLLLLWLWQLVDGTVSYLMNCIST